MNKNEGLPFKSYSNQLVMNLEDADAGVRDVAKGCRGRALPVRSQLKTWLCDSRLTAKQTRTRARKSEPQENNSSALTFGKPLQRTSLPI